MSSPFKLFRKHEKIMMVVATGLAMVSFVLLGAISDPRNVDSSLMVILFAALAGCVGWLLGLQNKKSTEWGVSGIMFGAVAGLAVMLSMRTPSAVMMDGGNLSGQELADLRRQRYVANSFLRQAFSRTENKDYNVLASNMFGFTNREQATSQDVIIGEILRRKSRELGIVISDEAALEVINKVSNNNMTKPLFKEIRKTLNVSETELMSALKAELEAQKVQELLYNSQNHLTPQDYWDFYKKINVRQSAELVAIPLASFIDEDAEPDEAALLELFEMHRENPPNVSDAGLPAEGRPGFLQPRRIQIGYLEALYDEVEPLVGEVTEEEIQKRYEERYMREMPAPAVKEMSNVELINLPLVAPEIPETEEPEEGDTEKPKDPATESEKPEDGKPSEGTEPAKDGEGQPATAPEKPAEEGKAPAEPKEEPKEEPAPEKPDAEKPAEKPAEPAPEAPAKPEAETPESPAKEEGDSTSQVPMIGPLQYVAFLQEEDAPKEATPPAGEEKPATEAEEKPAEPAETPAAEKPEEKPAEKPADGKAPEKTPAPKKSDGEKPADPEAGDAPDKAEMKEDGEPADGEEEAGESAIPPAPKTNIRPLDDELKMQIRDDLLREKTLAEVQVRIQAAYTFLNGISYRVQLEDTAENYLSMDDAVAEIQKYAKKNVLIYIEAEPMSRFEMQQSEDYPVGQAVSTIGQRQLVSNAIFQTAPTAKYSVGRADRFVSNNSYAYWKLVDEPSYAPVNMEKEVVRNQVVAEWRKQQALPKAEARAEELIKMIKESDKAVSVTLGETTVTGDDESLFLTVRETGDFTWMQAPAAAPTSMQSQPARQSVIPGVEDAGIRFFKTVFEDMKPGDVATAHSRDDETLYIVKVKDRYPNSDEEIANLRTQFLADMQMRERNRQMFRQFLGRDMPDTYTYLEQEELYTHHVNWIDQLWEDNNVQLFEEDTEG